MKQTADTPFLLRAIAAGFEMALLPIFIIFALRSRFKKKPIDIGIGPVPLISHPYHKQALQQYGYTVETFVATIWFVTDNFDVRADKIFGSRNRFLRLPALYLAHIYLAFLTLSRYRCLYFYFNGGPLGLGSVILRRFEPFFYRLAGVKVVVMAYGGDVQELTRSPNLLFKDAYGNDYPRHRFRRGRVSADIDRWTKYANHVIGGCEWVDYMYHWDTIMLSHFAIDIQQWMPSGQDSGRASGADRKLRILHAPNHRRLKGSQYFVDACRELVAEGEAIELVLLEGVPNDRIRDVMASVDVVADQLVIGWYAMFAIEAMAMGKPVLCYLRPDLVDLYIDAGLVNAGEIPIINCSPSTVKETIRRLATHPEELPALGRQSRQFVENHHSLDSIGAVFDRVNRSIGLKR
jgi:glycosyltransferase involved in cell wall biosynthesis